MSDKEAEGEKKEDSAHTAQEDDAPKSKSKSKSKKSASKKEESAATALCAVTEQPGAQGGGGGGGGSLAGVDYFRIKTRIKRCFIPCCTMETENDYLIESQDGKPLFMAKEESTCCCRYCGSTGRATTLNIMDPSGTPVLKVQRYCRCSPTSCWYFCCPQDVTVYDGTGVVKKGATTLRFGCCGPQWFDVEDTNGDLKYTLESPCICCNEICYGLCVCFCCVNKKFTIRKGLQQGGGEEVGEIIRNPTRSTPEGEDAFYIKISDSSMSDDDKMLLIASTFLADLIFFERCSNKLE